jgi:hypothetical protein
VAALAHPYLLDRTDEPPAVGAHASSGEALGLWTTRRVSG